MDGIWSENFVSFQSIPFEIYFGKVEEFTDKHISLYHFQYIHCRRFATKIELIQKFKCVFPKKSEQKLILVCGVKILDSNEHSHNFNKALSLLALKQIHFVPIAYT